jgi:hypothetical protein
VGFGHLAQGLHEHAGIVTFEEWLARLKASADCVKWKNPPHMKNM